MKLPVQGKVQIFLDGKLVSAGKNTVVTSGLVLLAQRIFGTEGIMLPNEMRLGDNGASTTVDMTGLQGTTQATASATASLVGRVLAFDSEFRYLGDNSFEFKEVGLFNAAGTMLCRFLTSFLTVYPGAQIKIHWEITIGD